MKKFLLAIFPYRLYLHIFQLEHYDILRTLSWIFTHFFKRNTQNKKPLVWTKKAKTITWLSGLFIILFPSIGWLLSSLSLGIIFALILLLQPYILIIFSLVLLKPYEMWNRAQTIRNTWKKIESLKRTKVIGIAGSYGKTSVKDILYHLLSSKYKVLKTPMSYNTIFGIAQVVDLELDDSYDFFICELGEFQPGDIIEMCHMVMPTHGIITGINDQHLERFKKIENTIATIFELPEYLLIKNKKITANLANRFIKSEIEKRGIQGNTISYGIEKNDAFATDVHFEDKGSQFNLHLGGMSESIQTPLLGNAHINNILGASAMAYELGVSIEDIIKRLSTAPKVPHRFEQTLLHTGYLLVDNSYSSNSDSFREALEILKKVSRKNKILVTPGMVELGGSSNQTHEDLGYQAGQVCTMVILVGESDRTKYLAKGIGEGKYVYIDDIRNLWNKVEGLGFNPTDTMILLENDLPDNY